ncbi:hypothetical protein [Nevskia soli]|uniref:hypothetical protein n=1 Tax=Nevskia soli TaxID=418856 RepID=UPI0015D74FC9|nr:hypothetical protein [Nevskia soli]
MSPIGRDGLLAAMGSALDSVLRSGEELGIGREVDGELKANLVAARARVELLRALNAIDMRHQGDYAGQPPDAAQAAAAGA